MKWSDHHPVIFELLHFLILMGSLTIALICWHFHVLGYYFLVGVVSAVIWGTLIGTKDRVTGLIFSVLFWPGMIPLLAIWLLQHGLATKSEIDSQE